MKFTEFICFDATIQQLETEDRDQVIRALVESLDKAGKLPEGLCEDILQAVISRENEASTGMGKGVAVPHVKHPAVNEVIGAVGISEKGIDFNALDKQPVFSVILLVSPAGSPEKHLQAMETIFKHLQEEKFRRFLRQSRSAEQIEDLLREADECPSW